VGRRESPLVAVERFSFFPTVGDMRLSYRYPPPQAVIYGDE
jgi:CRISPR-associated Cas5-like protein